MQKVLSWISRKKISAPAAEDFRMILTLSETSLRACHAGRSKCKCVVMRPIEEESPCMHDFDFQERKTFLSQAEEYFHQENYRTALEIARSRLSRTPGDLDARIVICRIWIQQGRIDNVREMLGEMEDILASLAQIYACMGNICRKKGLHESAEVFYRKFNLLNPGARIARDESVRLMKIASQHNILATTQGEKEDGQDPSDYWMAPPEEADIRHDLLSPTQAALEGSRVPQQEKRAEALLEVREMVRQEATTGRLTLIITKRSRWLDNIPRLRDQAEPNRSPRLYPP